MCLQLKIEELNLAKNPQQLKEARENVIFEVNRVFSNRMLEFAEKGFPVEVIVEETLCRCIPVDEDEYYENSREKALRQYHEGEIVLGADDCSNIAIFPAIDGRDI